MRRIFRFLKAYWNYLLYGDQVTFDEYVRRLTICHDCDCIDREKYQCKKCGCFMDKKCKMNTEHCVDEKW